jgi:hypothetical protein
LLRLLPRQRERAVDWLRALAASGDASALHTVFADAGYHGVSGVIDPLITAAADLPADLRAQAARRLAVEELWQAHVQRSLEQAVTVLHAAGVRPCALKGPVLGARLYAPEAIRHCMDVDLLVSQDDFERSVRAMEGAGYVPEAGVSVEHSLRYSHHLAFTRESSAPIELHFRTYAGFGVHVTADLMLTRATDYPLGTSSSVLIPSPEDEFIYLAVHAAGHSFCRLVWLYDLKLLVERNTGIEWTDVADRAARAGVLSAVAYTVDVLRRWLDVDLGALPPALQPKGIGPRLADRLLDEVSRPQRRSALENFGGLVFTSLLCDRRSSAVWQFQHHMLRAARRRIYRLAPRALPEYWNA